MRITRTLLQQSITLTRSTALDFVHHLRAILREITYIPDPFSRKYHHDYILSRFREFSPKKPQRQASNWYINRKYIVNQAHLTRCLEKCQEKLSFYYRAGNGDHRALKRALWLAHGRVGKRKHILLRPYLLPDVPEDAKEMEQALNAPVVRTLDLPKSLSAILMQQGKQPGTNLSTIEKNVKRFFQPVLPETTTWGRPMPQNRLVNKKKMLMSDLTEKVFPPLPDEEFGRIEDLAKGIIPCPPIPRRRRRLEGLPALPPLQSNHKITPRTMRRLWSQLLPLCSKIYHDPVQHEWIVTWGSAAMCTLDSLKVGDRNVLTLENCETPAKHD